MPKFGILSLRLVDVEFAECTLNFVDDKCDTAQHAYSRLPHVIW